MNKAHAKGTKFWNNCRVCVTGGGGFLGSYVVAQLEQKGAKEIFVPRKKDYDLVQPEAINQLLVDAKPNLIIHLAAQVGGIGANRLHPAEYFYHNLMMGVQLQHKAWEAGVDKFVGIGTVCAYPKHTTVPFKEEDLWNGYPEETNAPYGLAKKMMLVQSQAYRQQYGFNSIFLLPVNLYGPRDNFDLETSHVIPALIRKCVEAKLKGDSQIIVWGDGSPTREFLFVEDAATAIILASEHYDSSEPVNIGSAFEISIVDLVNLIVELTGYEGNIIWDSNKPNGQPRRKLDVERAKKAFDFVSTTNFETGLKRTIDYFQEQVLVSNSV